VRACPTAVKPGEKWVRFPVSRFLPMDRVSQLLTACANAWRRELASHLRLNSGLTKAVLLRLQRCLRTAG
jgi:hypothetical protein